MPIYRRKINIKYTYIYAVKQLFSRYPFLYKLLWSLDILCLSLNKDFFKCHYQRISYEKVSYSDDYNGKIQNQDHEMITDVVPQNTFLVVY